MGPSNLPLRLTGALRLILTVLILLFVRSSLAAQTELITNGSFVNGSTGWTRSGNFFADSRFTNCHTCPGYSYVTNSDGTAGNNLTGTMFQAVNVPSNTTTATISFWYYITTQETEFTSFDTLNVTIQNSSGAFLANVAFLSNVNSGSGYAQRSVTLDLTPYRGQTIRLNFLGTTDFSLPSTFRVDDVSILANLVSGSPVVRIDPTTLTFNEPVSNASSFALSSLGSAEDQAKLQRANRNDEPVRGQSDIASVTSVVNFAELARRDALQQPTPQQPPRFVPEPEEEEERDRPVPPDATVFPQESSSALKAIEPLGPSPVTSSSFLGVSATGWYPPDSQGVAGPNHLMVAVNGGLVIQTKSGTNVGSVRSLVSFFGPVTNGSGDVFDPRLQYDPLGNRWIVIAVADRKSAASAILVAVSQTNDPTGNWNLTRIDADPIDQSWADYPMLGFNKDWIVISANMFPNPNSSASFHAQFYVLNKVNFYAGGANFTRISGPSSISSHIMPASTFDPNLSTLYLLQNWNGNSGGSGFLRLYSITGAVGGEVLNNTTSAVFISTPNPWDSSASGNFGPQLGTSSKIDVGNATIQNLLYRNGSLWCAHTVFLPAGSPTRSSVQWWQINPTGLAVQQRGRIDDASGNLFYGFPSIAVNTDNDVLIGYSRFAANQFASAGYAFRTAGDAINSLRDDTVLKAGAASYNVLDDIGRNRWGDYSGTSVDPSNGKEFWTLQEYTAATNSWSTWWGRITPPNTQPSVFKVFTVFNDGTSTLTVNSISKQNNSSWLSIDPSTAPPFNVAPGQSANVAVLVNTGGLSAGSYSDRLLVNSNDSGRSPYPNGVFVNLNVGNVNACSQTPITFGQTLSGSLSSSDCVVSGTSRLKDVYSFSGVAGQGISASMDSASFDTYLYLTNSTGQIISEDNDSGPGTNSRIPDSSAFFTLPASGSYFLWASSATNNATGPYSIGLSQCTYSLSSSANTVGPGSGSTNFSILTSSGCAWTAVSDATSWLTTSSTGSGDGTVTYNTAANTSTSTRVGHITVGGRVHTVTQIGVGGAGSVQFSSATYSVNEGGGTATITVTRSSGIGSGTVSYSTSNGTATAGSDYQSASGVLIFPENVTSRTFDVTILDDSAFEGNETINLVLSAPSLSLTLGNPSSATLTITDNDTSSTPTNYALAANGGSVTASSTLSPYVAGNVIDGSRRAVNSTLWLDNTFNSFGDWVEVSFNGSKTISEIDVITQQDTPNNPVEPTLTQTFSLYGVTAFDVQYWNGSAWTTVPGGSVTGNNKVWRQFTFTPITTTKIRVLVNGGADNAFSRLVEIEAWSGTPPPPTNSTNYALAANGGSVTASSTLSPYVAGNVIDGSRRALNNTLWLDSTFNSFGDWVEVNFNGSKTISEVDVITQQDNPSNLVEPTLAQTFTLYGVTAFDVQYWNGSAWTTVPGGSVTGNNKVWRQFTFAPITTTKIRVLVNGGADNAFSRLVEIEAWSGTPPTLTNYARATNGGSVTASSTLSPYVAGNVIDGSRRAVNNTLWLDSTFNSFGDWVEVSFNGSKTISEIDVITQQNDPNNLVEPTLAQTFSLYGITAFDVQYWNGASWTTVPGGSVTGNNKVWRQFTFTPITTTKIRVLVNGGADNAFSRVVEIEAWGSVSP